MTCLLDRVIAPGALTALFQPILDVESSGAPVHYLEALTRGPRDTTLESPCVLFSYARRKHAEAAVDRAAVRTILCAARELPGDLTVGINVHASTLAADADFTEYLDRTARESAIPPERLLVEVVEHGLPWDMKALREALAKLRDLGVRIALDDVGTGESNYLMILECRPQYLKIDGHFIRGCEADAGRRAVLASVVELARSLGAGVVAEGVESREELRAVRAAGIRLVQGFLWGRPCGASGYRAAASCSFAPVGDAPSTLPAPQTSGDGPFSFH